MIEVEECVFTDCSVANLKKNNKNLIPDKKIPDKDYSSTFEKEKTGTYYFVCGVGQHCEMHNQKAKITVKKNCDRKTRKRRGRKRRRRTHRH